jgi:hypothetical protein
MFLEYIQFMYDLFMMWRIRKREGGVTCVSLGVPPRCDCAIAVRSVCFRMCVVSCHDAGSPTAGLRWGWRYSTINREAMRWHRKSPGRRTSGPRGHESQLDHHLPWLFSGGGEAWDRSKLIMDLCQSVSVMTCCRRAALWTCHGGCARGFVILRWRWSETTSVYDTALAYRDVVRMHGICRRTMTRRRVQVCDPRKVTRL